ncbi:MAG: FAD-dependent oxidoreductase [Rhodobacteraceae bacterium]|nr:FAD-dependent oxidoreductase [Paracoccaceae bacterium]
MTKQVSPLWTHLTSEGRLTGTWRSAVPSYQDQPSPCLGACPVNGRIATWIKQVKDGDLHGAFVTLADNNPFPAIAGRVCHHPCQTACNRAAHDETVGICSLERSVGDTALSEGWHFPGPAKERSQTVAIIGGGPAGLSAAYQLRRIGFQVSLYEANDRLGGLMRYGIPAYRLDRSVLDGEVNRITAMGMELHLNTEITDQTALKNLRAEHDAVFLATGASRPKRLPNLDYSAAYVVDSAAFLADDEVEQKIRTGEHVLVIGGGSAAIDVARTARRLGRSVTVLSLEPEGELPAQQAELDEATEEGVIFISGAMMQRVNASGSSLEAGCIRVKFEAGKSAGEFVATPVSGSEFNLSTNTIIPAIGQDADLDRWKSLLDARGPVVDIEQWQTTAPGIFAGGDVASMERFVTNAVGMGKEAAKAIAAQLDAALAAPIPFNEPVVEKDRINTAYQDSSPRTHQNNVSVTKRLGSFDEVQQPLNPDQARAEATRCFGCGTCIYCDNCFFYCPDMAIARLDPGYEIKTDYCKGCGLCVAECPTGAIHMREDMTP